MSVAIGLPTATAAVNFVCIADRLEALKRKRGQVVTGVGEAANVSVDVEGDTEPAVGVKVSVSVSAVES